MNGNATELNLNEIGKIHGGFTDEGIIRDLGGAAVNTIIVGTTMLVTGDE